MNNFAQRYEYVKKLFNKIIYFDLHAPSFVSVESFAYKIKFTSQMIIGFCVFLILVSSASVEFFNVFSIPSGYVSDLKYPLRIVSYGLGVSAGIELAYMLFTPGPDEAVEPVILGLASTILYTLSIIDLNETSKLIQYSIFIIAMGISIGGLFFIKDRFVKVKEQKNT